MMANSVSQDGLYAIVLTKGGPDLPRHDQATADHRGRNLGREHRYCNFLETHAYAEQDTGHNKLRPGLNTGHSDRGANREDGGDEDDLASSKPMIQRIGDPSREKKNGEIPPSR